MTGSRADERRTPVEATKAAAVYLRFPELQPTQLPASPVESADEAA